LVALKASSALKPWKTPARKTSDDWKQAAREAQAAQRKQTAAEAEQKVLLALNAELDARTRADAGNTADEKKKKDADKAAKDLDAAKKKTDESRESAR